jgi:hypothetical protein
VVEQSGSVAPADRSSETLRVLLVKQEEQNRQTARPFLADAFPA